jgi:hypothetical protein
MTWNDIMKIQMIVIILGFFLFNLICFGEDIRRVSFSLARDQASYIYQAEVGNYKLELGNPNDYQRPTAWDSPLYIYEKDSIERCETESLLITDVYYFEKADMILISSYNGSMRYINFIDPQTGKNRYPEIEAFTEKIDISSNQIEMYPGCECIDESNNSYQCSSAQVILFNTDFQPVLDVRASDELTKKIIGVVFRGDENILFPKTKDAKVINR